MKKQPLPDHLDDNELLLLIGNIAKPSYKFLLRQIKKQIFQGNYTKMPSLVYAEIVDTAVASIVVNVLMHTAKSLAKENPFDLVVKLQNHFLDTLQHHFDDRIKLEKH